MGVFPGAGGRGDEELLPNGYRVAVWDDENILGRDGALIAQNENALSVVGPHI